MSEHAVDHAHDHDDEAEGVPAASLTMDSTPGLAPSVAMVVLEGEGVVLDEATRATHLLNPSATLTVQCLDGTSTLAAICDDLADGLQVPLALLQEDVLQLVRALGDKGLLEGVRPTPHVHQAPEQPTLPVGTRLSGLEGTVQGVPVDDAWLTAEPSMLVSWSPGCGYCTRIVDDLVDGHDALTASGVRLVLVTTASPEAVEGQFGGRPMPPLAQVEQLPDFFAGLGTPVAYATDSSGATLERLALGAVEVPDLLRRLAAPPA